MAVLKAARALGLVDALDEVRLHPYMIELEGHCLGGCGELLSHTQTSTCARHAMRCNSCLAETVLAKCLQACRAVSATPAAETLLEHNPTNPKQIPMAAGAAAGRAAVRAAGGAPAGRGRLGQPGAGRGRAAHGVLPAEGQCAALCACWPLCMSAAPLHVLVWPASAGR